MTTALNFLRFLGRSVEKLLWRCRHKGWHSAWVYFRWWANDLYVRQRNKRWPGNRVECPCCGWHGYDFGPMDGTFFWLRSVYCPSCGSHERQRMLQIFLTRYAPDVMVGSIRILHIAPEPEVRALLCRNQSLRYLASDYCFEKVQAFAPHGRGLQSDLQHLGLSTAAFDLAICLHVLEHVPDDRAAIAEIHRILKPGGTAIIMVPFDMTIQETYQWPEPNPDIYYHIWAYALSDFKERLAPFTFEEIAPATFLSPAETNRYRIPPKEVIYRCKKT